MKLAIPTAATQWIADHGDMVSPVRWARFARQTGLLLSFVLLLLAWQIALFLALFEGLIRLSAYIEIHVFGCVALAAFPAFRLRRSLADQRDLAALQIVAWSAFAGPFGAFVATALALPTAAPPLRIESDADDLTADRSATERIERAHVALVDRRVRLEGASRIRPLIDVIVEGSRAEKLEALRVVYRRYEARLSTVLSSALTDSDTSVRVLAATVIAKLNATHSRDIGDRQRETVANPKLAQNWQALAETRVAYAQSGLLDPARAQALIELAIGDASRATALDPACGAPSVLLQARRSSPETCE